MPLSEAERTKNARRAQLLRSAKHDGRVVTENARSTFRASFDPPAMPGETAADKRARLARGDAAYRAYMSRLGERGRQARAAAAAERRRLAGM
jgi:hypothetical protein